MSYRKKIRFKAGLIPILMGISTLHAMEFKPETPIKSLGNIEFGGFFQYDIGISGFTEKTIGIRRLRTEFKGSITEEISYKINIKYDDGSATLLDGYIDLKLTPKEWLRIGKTKSPIGLERLQVNSNLLLPEFGFTTYLIPNRDSGIQYIQKTPTQELNLGLFIGASDGQNADTESNKSQSLAGRFFLTPLNQKNERFGIGIGGNLEQKTGNATATGTGITTYTYPGYGSFFTYKNTTYTNGTGYRIVPQSYYYKGPFGLMGEYAISAQELSNGSDAINAKNEAWQLSFQYILTGENASYGSITPKLPFKSGKGLGAIQIGLRASSLRFDNEAFGTLVATDQAKEMKQYGASINWIWSQNVQWTLAVEQLHRINKNESESRQTLTLIRSQIKF